MQKKKKNKEEHESRNLTPEDENEITPKKIELVSKEEMEKILGADTKSVRSETQNPVHDENPENNIEELLKKAAERDEFFDLLQRTKADFQNYQKRQASAYKDTREETTREMAREILSAIDDLKRAISSQPELAENATRGALEMIHGKFMKVLRDFGVEPIESAGKPFDPRFHEAMLVEETDDLPNQTVMEVFEEGYRLGDKIVRTARVKVSKKPKKEPTD